MSQMSKEHEEWAKAREEERQEGRSIRAARLKTCGLVIVAIVIGWFLYRHVLGPMAVAPTFGLVLLAYRWDRAFPPPGTGNAALAGALYRWTYSKPFGSDARRAFLRIYSRNLIFKLPDWRDAPFLHELEDEKLDAFLQDLPDLKRLAEDRAYASQAFRRATLKRLIPLLVLDIVYHLALIVAYPPIAAWCALAAVLTGLIAVPVARSGALGNLDHFMHSYAWVHVYLRDTKKEELKEMLTAAGLSELIKENA